jgi:pimeloyl-ACP methyl ester carboxylesterase
MALNEQIHATDLTVTGVATGAPLHVRRKRRKDLGKAPGERIVLCLHGATYPASGTFDLQLEGLSWMDDLAQAGFDVYALDLAGYGGSASWAPMQQPAEGTAPLLSTADAVADLGGVIEHILRAAEVERLCLLGWSWGSTICGSYAARHPSKVERLVLHAPQWIRQTPSAINLSGPMGAYRTVSAADGVERWIGAVPEACRDAAVPPAWRAAWVEANFAPAADNPQVKSLRAPNGVLKDNSETWASGKPLYDPSTIEAPTLLILGEWDRDTPPYMANAVFSELKKAREKRLVLLGGGTHMLMLEAPRQRLFDETRLFLLQG